MPGFAYHTLNLDGKDRQNGREWRIPATGGVRFDSVPASGLEFAFDEQGADRRPIIEGKKYRGAFKRLFIFHGAGMTGTLIAETFSCGEDIDAAPPGYAGDPAAERALDYSLAFPSYGQVGRIGDAHSDYPGVIGRRGTNIVNVSGSTSSSTSRLRGLGTVGTYRHLGRRPTLALPSNVAGARSILLSTDMWPGRTSKPAAASAEVPSATSFMRVLAVLGIESGALNAGVAGSEVGLSFISNGDSSSITNIHGINLSGGFGWQFRTGDGTWRPVIRKTTSPIGGTGPSTLGDAVAAANVRPEFNVPEIRVYPATADDEAYVEWWFNGELVRAEVWGTGTLLPVIGTGGDSGMTTATGFFPGVVHEQDNTAVALIPAPGLHVADFRVIAGPTAASIED